MQRRALRHTDALQRSPMIGPARHSPDSSRPGAPASIKESADADSAAGVRSRSGARDNGVTLGAPGFGGSVAPLPDSRRLIVELREPSLAQTHKTVVAQFAAGSKTVYLPDPGVMAENRIVIYETGNNYASDSKG